VSIYSQTAAQAATGGSLSLLPLSSQKGGTIRGRRIVIRTRLVLAIILAVTLYISLRWVAFTFEAEIERMMVRIEYQRVEKGIGKPPELIRP